MDPDKFLFTSDYPIDKVVHTGTLTIVNDGQTSGQSGSWQTSKYVDSGILANPVGRDCFIRFVWSIDGGTNWQSSTTHLWYGYQVFYPGLTANLGGVQGAVSAGCSNTGMIFNTINGSHGNVSVNSGGGASYTPISRTFNIKYVMYAWEP